MGSVVSTRESDTLIGLEGFTLPRIAPLSLVELAANTGFDAVGVRLVDPATNTPLISASGAHALREHAERRGMTLYGADMIDLEGPQDRLEECLRVLAAGGLGRVSCFHRGDDLRAASAAFRALVIAAQSHGVIAHIEPVSYFGVRTIAQVADLVEDAGGGGLTLDTLHFGRVQDDPGMLAELAGAVPMWMQVCDGPALETLLSAKDDVESRTAALRHESIGERLLPGRGVCAVGDIVGAVRAGTAHARTVHAGTGQSGLTLMVEAPHAIAVRERGARAYAAECLAATRSLVAALPEGGPQWDSE